MLKKTTIEDTKSTALNKSPVSKNKLFMKSNPPKKTYKEKIIGTSNIPASKRSAAHKSINPSILTIMIFANIDNLKACP